MTFQNGSSKNFNDYKDVGFYSIYNPYENVPDTSMSGNYSYSLIVNKGQLKNGTYDIDQIAISQNGDMYIRQCIRGVMWYNWIRISNTNARPLEVNRGGTGASNSKQALINLGIPEIPSTGAYTLQSSDGVLSWVSGS